MNTNIWLDRKANGFWDCIETQRNYMKYLARVMGYENLEDWYNVEQGDFRKVGGEGLFLKRYSNVVSLLRAMYPDQSWMPWKFKKAPSGFWKSLENQREYLEWLGGVLGYSNLDDWYNVEHSDFKKNYGNGLVCTTTPISLLQAVYPEHSWMPWKFKKTPDGFWTSLDNQRNYMDWLGNVLGFTTREDWYNIKQTDFVNNGGDGLLKRNYTNTIQMLRAVYSDFVWVPWKLQNTPDGFWNSLENQREYMDWLGLTLGYRTLDDWYTIEQKDFESNHGSGLLTGRYKHSTILLLRAIYPEHTWMPWKLRQAPSGFWNSLENQKSYIKWLGVRLEYHKLDDWYKVSLEQFINNYGTSLVQKHRQSPWRVLCAIFPEHTWYPWKFLPTPKSFWKNLKNQRDYIDWLGKDLGISNMDDWYNTDTQKIHNRYGETILQSYGGSLYHALSAVYPDYKWLPWRFSKVPRGFWNSLDNQKWYADWLGKLLGYTCMNDWYKLSTADITNNNGGGMFTLKYGTLFAMVKTIYPDYPWIKRKFKCQQFSRLSITWLNYVQISRGVIIQHGDSDLGEFKVPGTNFRADGYCSETNTIYEFHGDLWHSNPTIFPGDDIHPIFKVSHQQTHKKTIDKQDALIKLGYTLVVMWESDWKVFIQKVKRIQRHWKAKKARARPKIQKE